MASLLSSEFCTAYSSFCTSMSSSWISYYRSSSAARTSAGSMASYVPERPSPSSSTTAASSSVNGGHFSKPPLTIVSSESQNLPFSSSVGASKHTASTSVLHQAQLGSPEHCRQVGYSLQGLLAQLSNSHGEQASAAANGPFEFPSTHLCSMEHQPQLLFAEHSSQFRNYEQTVPAGSCDCSSSSCALRSSISRCSSSR